MCGTWRRAAPPAKRKLHSSKGEVCYVIAELGDAQDAVDAMACHQEGDFPLCLSICPCHKDGKDIMGMEVSVSLSMQVAQG